MLFDTFLPVSAKVTGKLKGFAVRSAPNGCMSCHKDFGICSVMTVIMFCLSCKLVLHEVDGAG